MGDPVSTTTDAPRPGEELTWQLDRLLPSSLEDAQASDAVDQFVLFVSRLTKLEHERVIGLLPGRLKFQQLSTTAVLTSYGVMIERQTFIDTIAFQTVFLYLRHVSPYEIIAHLLLRLRIKPGKGLRALTARMSYPVRHGLYAELIVQDDADVDRYGVIDELEQTLAEQFDGVRPGLLDRVIVLLIEQANKNWDGAADKVRWDFEGYMLQRTQDKRRRDPNRLPALTSVANVRFVVEEVQRELFTYPNADFDKATELLYSVDAWYDKSKMRKKIVGKPIFLEIMHFFTELLSTARRLKLGGRYAEVWKVYVDPFLNDERFWHNLAGLDGDPNVPYETTEAARREAAYRRGAVLGPLAIVAPLVIVLAIAVAVRAPGAAIRFGRWVAGNLLLATQYAAATYRVYGAIAGTAVVARDAFVFYLQHAVEVNQAVVQGTEIVLELSGQESGMAPGSSPADLAEVATARAARVAKKGVLELAADLKNGERALETEIELVELVVKGDDGKFYKVVGTVEGFHDGKVKTNVIQVTEVLDDYAAASKKLIFYSAPAEASAARRSRGVIGAAANVPPPTVVSSVSRGSLLASPRNTVIAGKKVKSWHPQVLVGTSQDQMRRGSLSIIKTSPSHPMAGVLVDGKFLNGGNKAIWAKDSRYLQAAHVRSGKEGGPDIIVLMSAKYNQAYASDLEQSGKSGAMVLDEVFDIGGIAMHKQTARDLVAEGKMEQKALDDAKTIDLRNLELEPTSTTTAKARGTGDTKAGSTNRMTGGSARPTPPPNVGTGGLSSVPANTRIAGKRVKSWHPEVLVGTSEDQMRAASLAIINGKKHHALERVLVDGRFLNGGSMAQWEKDARFLQAAHVRSKKVGGEDVIVLMSAKHNQKFSADLERAGTPGAIALDEVFDIDGIAIHKATAWDLVEQGWLEKSVVKNARSIDLTHLAI